VFSAACSTEYNLPSRRIREGESAAETASWQARAEDDKDDKTVTHILKMYE
jgi:hypothetical protein